MSDQLQVKVIYKSKLTRKRFLEQQMFSDSSSLDPKAVPLDYWSCDVPIIQGPRPEQVILSPPFVLEIEMTDRQFL